MSNGSILAAIYNTIPRKKGAVSYTYKDFMPDKFVSNIPKENKKPSSSAEITRDWVKRHNKNFPDDLIKFDYNKHKN